MNRGEQLTAGYKKTSTLEKDIYTLKKMFH